MNEQKLIITPKTKIGELLKAYPELESVLMDLSPAFKKLKNPVLRRTIGRVATIGQAAGTGNVPLNQIIQRLRKEIGQEHIADEPIEGHTYLIEQPDWFDPSKIKATFDARPVIEKGQSPMAEIMNKIKQIEKDELFELITPFIPTPIIDTLTSQGYKYWTRKENEQVFKTYFRLMSNQVSFDG